MSEICVNEVAINMDVAIGEELDYEANDNIEHEEDGAEKVETNQYERIVKEVSTSDGDECVNNTDCTERTNDITKNNSDSKDSKSFRDSKTKIDETGDLQKKKEEKKETDSKDKKQTSSSSSSRAVCKPCNLVFENKKWQDKHNESGDHTHVIKGFNPGGGKYYCYLCWLGFEHSEMMLHHIKRSEHITRARRRGVCDIYLKPTPKSSEKPSSQPTTTKPGRDRVDHRSGSHKTSSGPSHRSRSPLRIRLSDYYEVSSVGHCDTRGVRLRSLSNGVHKIRGKEEEEVEERVKSEKLDSESRPGDDRSSHKKDLSINKSVAEQVQSCESESVSRRATNTHNGVAVADPEEISGSRGELKDLSHGLISDPPDESERQVNSIENVSETKEASDNVVVSCEEPTQLGRMDTT